MVVALGPGRFYGSSLPRPRIYTDVKFSNDRVDPPVPVTDPLMSWAQEAHWSMGGLNVKRHRLQGRIEGSVVKLRAQREKALKKRNAHPSPAKPIHTKSSAGSAPTRVDRDPSPSPPPAPFAAKRRRRLVGLVDEDDEVEERGWDGVVSPLKPRPARKLWDDFDRVAAESSSPISPVKRSSSGSETVALRTRSRKDEKRSGGVRTSPRLAKRGSS
ncbi:hypothetical protein RJ640_012213 [Escallonia rubra]|uniref:Uncharacterized protein n=1 Tax=Escallonia rubra TaxID=112253 RepID=A0AA88R823_9ASTE|nr:hypothetical protein RJ640_000188 [Escallonia rubra]KAK2980343.1 hypothetical protein RJ640_012213 [Escallonia rubra]